VVVGNYLIDREIGRGGMGVVYAATHRVLGKRAAIKVLANPDQDVERFFNEGRAAMSIEHPNVVRVFDVGRASDGRAYIAMELLDGESLSARLRRGALPVRTAVGIALQIAEALIAVHAVEIIHRDLKPENVIVCGDRIKLVDFGVAKLTGPLAGPVRTISGALVGTPIYMSPEQCEGVRELDARSDLYSLGCVLYAMLAGLPPFTSSGTGALISMHMFKEPPMLRTACPTASSALAGVVARLLAKSPAERFQSAREVARALADPAMVELSDTASADATADSIPVAKSITPPDIVVVTDAGTTPRSDTPAGAPAKSKSRRVVLRSIAIAVAVVAIGVPIAVVIGKTSSRGEPNAVRTADAAVVVPVVVVDAGDPGSVDAPIAPVVDVVAETVTITLVNAPSSTEAHIGGKPFGVGPRIVVPRGDREVILVLSRDGYRSRSIPITPNADRSIDAKLESRGRRPDDGQPTNDMLDLP